MTFDRDELEIGEVYLIEVRPNSKNSTIFGPAKVKFLGFGRTSEGGNPDEWQRFIQLFENKIQSKEFSLHNVQIHNLRKGLEDES